MMNNRFKITKIGLLNFWLYDEEEYDFYGGNLILRGTNGSGKSVTMQSFIPLILDGNKSPDRLDPFGEKERRIEDYILGDPDSPQKEEATSYLYMECLKADENKYITIGIGFRGRKGKPTEEWGFALKDGKRIGKDFFLYKDASNKIPLSKNELKSRLDGINEFTDTNKDYKAMVNRLLFGFPNTDAYDEFIKIILQLRSNKLSKGNKPTDLIKILNSVLQPLTDDDLRPLSEAIEEMNKTKEQVETLEKNSKSLGEFLKVYKNYNETVLLTKARNYSNINNEYKELAGNIETLTKEFESFQVSLQEKTKRLIEVDDEININSEKKKNLDNQDLKRQIEELSKIEETIKILQLKIASINDGIEKDDDERIDFINKIKSLEDETFNLKKDLNEAGIELKSFSEETGFDEIVFFIDELNEKLEVQTSFESILMSLSRYSEKINKLLDCLEKEKSILQESENIRLEFEKLKSAYNELERKISELESNLKELVLSWQEDFINILNNNKYLKLDDYSKKQIFNLMNDYSRSSYDESRNIYINFAHDLIGTFTTNKLKLENKKSSREIDLSELKLQYEELKNSKDYELPSLNETTDKILQENKIENVPLYKCIEFKANIDEKIKNNIESSLLDLNILNAKVINEADQSKIKKLNTEILYLTKSTKKKVNILRYIEVKIPDGINISKNYVESILECISIDSNDALSIGENGLSKIDCLNSIADSNYKQAFIGYMKRCELKNAKLKEYEAGIEQLSKEILDLEELIQEEENKISTTSDEINNFPASTKIDKCLDIIKNLKVEIDYNDQRQKELESTLSKYDSKLMSIREEISENKSGIYVPINYSSIKNTSIQLDAIRECLRTLENMHNTYLSKLELTNSFKERLESIEESIDYKQSELSDRTSELKINTATRDNINELLNTKKYKDLGDELRRLEESLKNLVLENKTLEREIATLENEIKHAESNLNTLNETKSSKEKLVEIYKEIFLREYNLKYVYQEDITELEKVVKSIIKDGNSKKELKLNEALSNFYASFNHYSLELNDYSLRNITLFNDYEFASEDYQKIYSENTRVDVSAMYQGIKVNIIELFSKMNIDIEENKLLISEQDRHLFEDILLNTVGDKIRDRIYSSNEWISKINKIMSEMQENSALSFKLVWKSIPANTDDEIDTKELVKILKTDPELLSDKDKNNLTNHFRSKIKKAEQLFEDSYISFYKIIESVLDYRSWFTFQLLYQRKGMNQKELTDKTFSKFSGGEKAKSMYIPLFASCYAKLMLAANDALRVIALDEAFAGVDEDNIREMFGILKYLSMNFIINSQVLWGDYDTIDDLSICELIRPQNSQVVTVERYRWNGKYKELILNRNEQNEEQ